MLTPSVRTGISTHRKTTRLATMRRSTRTVVRRGCRPKRMSLAEANVRNGAPALLPRRVRRQQAGRVVGDRDVNRVGLLITRDVDPEAALLARSRENGRIDRDGR